MDDRNIGRLHARLEVAEMLRDLGQNFHPLLNLVMKDINEIQSELLDQPQDNRPKVVTPPSGPASSNLVDQETGEAEQIPDPQLPRAIPADRAPGAETAVDNSLRGVPDATVAPGHVERRSE